MDTVQLIFVVLMAAGLLVTLAVIVGARRRKERARAELLRKLGSAIIHPKVGNEAAAEMQHEPVRRSMPLVTPYNPESCPKAEPAAQVSETVEQKKKTEKKTFTRVV